MPNISEEVKAFDLLRAEWFAKAVRDRRTALKLTASELSRRTADLGYPVSRGAIAKIESNLRAGKIDVSEVLVLAAALDIPPVLLLFPGVGSDGGSDALPGHFTTHLEAVRWMSGQVSFPQGYEGITMSPKGPPRPPNDGVNLIAAMALLEQVLENRASLVHYRHTVREDPAEARVAETMLQKNSEQVEAARQQIRDAREALFRMRGQNEVVENEDGDD